MIILFLNAYYVTRTPSNESAVYLKHDRDRDIYIYEFSNKFDTVLYQFLETGTSDITFMGLDQELKWLAFSLYPF